MDVKPAAPKIPLPPAPEVWTPPPTGETAPLPGTEAPIGEPRRRAPMLIAIGIAAAAVLAIAIGLVLTLSEDPAGPTVDTSAGTFTVSEVQLLDSLPEDCVSGPGCLEPIEGYQVLVVYLEPGTGAGDLDFDVAGSVHVRTADGTSSPGEVIGTEFSEGQTTRQYIGFGVPQGAQGLELIWPDNDPIPLEV